MTSTAHFTEDNQDDIRRAGELFEQSLQFFQAGDFQSAIFNYQQALETYRELKVESETARTLNAIGIVYYKLGKIDSAAEAYQEAQEIAQKISHKELQGRITNNLGLLAKSNGEYSNALNLYEKSFFIFQELEDLSEQVNILDNIGFVYYQGNAYEKAMYCYDYALYLLREDGSKNQEAEIRILRNLISTLRFALQASGRYKALSNQSPEFQNSSLLSQESTAIDFQLDENPERHSKLPALSMLEMYRRTVSSDTEEAENPADSHTSGP